MDIGLLIKRHRDENNLTLREFAARCGTSHSYIAMLENRKNSKTGDPIIPSISMMKKIAKGMGMSINDLIALCDDMEVTLNGTPELNLQLFAKKSPEEPKLTEGETLLLELFRQVPAEQQNLVLDMIRVALGKKE
jgi:transcriptional regulator with XRE-family HTH domain